MLDWKKEVSQDKYFYCRCGKVFKDIDEFMQALERMKEPKDFEDFKFHSYNAGNDFANWIRGVFQLNDLADRIKDIHEPDKMLAEIINYKVKMEDEEELEKPEKATEKKSEEKPQDKLQAEPYDEEKLKKNVAEFGEQSDFLFDKVKKMRMKSYLNKKSFEEKVADIYEIYDNMNLAVSEKRKKGYDMLIPALKLKNIKAKIKFMEISQKKEDYNRVATLLNDIGDEIKEASQKLPLDLKQEVLEAAGVAKPKVEE